MDKDLKHLVNKTVDFFFEFALPRTDLPPSGEEKYEKQEPGGEMMTANVSTPTWRESIEEANYRIYNDSLCPAMWSSDMHLDPEVRASLLQMAQDFYEKTGFKAPILDIYLMGSIANYNWTVDSDADVHVIIDYNQLQMPPETAIEAVKTAGAKWNAEHNATVKGHKVEINVQNVREVKPHVTGIYSLVKDAWIRVPQHQGSQFNTVAIQEKYKGMKRYLEAALRSGDRETMKQAKKYLDAFRQYGLDTAGELSVENIVFKIIRSKGLIKALKDAITATYDKEMSVKEVGTKDLKQTLPRDPSQYQYDDEGKLKLGMLTLDHLMALRAKAARGIAYIKSGKGGEAFAASLQREEEEFKRLSAEIKRRIEYINKPVAKEGYGAGDPSKDPKARGRWTVDFESSSRILKEIASNDPHDIWNQAVRSAAMQQMPSLSDPIEAKRMFRTNFIEMAKAARAFIRTVMEQDGEGANRAANFISEVSNRMATLLQHWTQTLIAQHPDKKDQIIRQYREVIRHIEQVTNQLTSIYTKVIDPDSRATAIPDFKHLGEIFKNLMDSTDALIDVKETEVDEARIYNPQFGTEFRTSTEYDLTPEEIAALKNMTPAERQKFAAEKLKQARRSKEQCISCGAPAMRKKDGSAGTYCQKHLEQFRNRRKELSKIRGSCTRCPNPPLPGKKLCQKCTDELELQRLAALSKNLCIRCKKAPMEPNAKGEPTLFCRDCMKIKVALNKRRKNFVKAWSDYGKDVEADALARKLKSQGIEPKEEISS